MTYIRIVFSAHLAACLSGNAEASEAEAEAESLYLAPVANESLGGELVSFLHEAKARLETSLMNAAERGVAKVGETWFLGAGI